MKELRGLLKSNDKIIYSFKCQRYIGPDALAILSHPRSRKLRFKDSTSSPSYGIDFAVPMLERASVKRDGLHWIIAIFSLFVRSMNMPLVCT
jgi:hypothetical protein